MWRKVYGESAREKVVAEISVKHTPGGNMEGHSKNIRK
jgi:hypothetical protein